MLTAMSQQPLTQERGDRHGKTCANCRVQVGADDFFCWNCGATIWDPQQNPPSDRNDASIGGGVTFTDWISLMLLTIGAFVGVSVVAALWRNRTGEQLPSPVENPIQAGAMAAGAIFIAGLLYLVFIAIRHRRRRH
jgi:hypothetical protein